MTFVKQEIFGGNNEDLLVDWTNVGVANSK